MKHQLCSLTQLRPIHELIASDISPTSNALPDVFAEQVCIDFTVWWMILRRKKYGWWMRNGIVPIVVWSHFQLAVHAGKLTVMCSAIANLIRFLQYHSQRLIL